MKCSCNEFEPCVQVRTSHHFGMNTWFDDRNCRCDNICLDFSGVTEFLYRLGLDFLFYGGCSHFQHGTELDLLADCGDWHWDSDKDVLAFLSTTTSRAHAESYGSVNGRELLKRLKVLIRSYCMRGFSSDSCEVITPWFSVISIDDDLGFWKAGMRKMRNPRGPFVLVQKRHLEENQHALQTYELYKKLKHATKIESFEWVVLVFHKLSHFLKSFVHFRQEHQFGNSEWVEISHFAHPHGKHLFLSLGIRNAFSLAGSIAILMGRGTCFGDDSV